MHVQDNDAHKEPRAFSCPAAPPICSRMPAKTQSSKHGCMSVRVCGLSVHSMSVCACGTNKPSRPCARAASASPRVQSVVIRHSVRVEAVVVLHVVRGHGCASRYDSPDERVDALQRLLVKNAKVELELAVTAIQQVSRDEIQQRLHVRLKRVRHEQLPHLLLACVGDEGRRAAYRSGASLVTLGRLALVGLLLASARTPAARRLLRRRAFLGWQRCR
mmetsp:Transcript_12738/g.37212  ORF Transcript_12738/g.37212 Transcript_12738/m.37212 type:complete len:218 (+) Transcript_12738:518-1171(+)